MSIPDFNVEYPLTVNDVADTFGYTAAHVRLLVREGKIPAVRRGRAYKFNPSEVHAALLHRPTKTVPVAKATLAQTAPIEESEQDFDQYDDLDIDLGI